MGAEQDPHQQDMARNRVALHSGAICLPMLSTVCVEHKPRSTRMVWGSAPSHARKDNSATGPCPAGEPGDSASVTRNSQKNL